jgi:hypothetical protein
MIEYGDVLYSIVYMVYGEKYVLLLTVVLCYGVQSMVIYYYLAERSGA